MKKLLLTAGLFTSLFTSNAQENNGITLTVVVENVLSNEGSVLSALHTEETFMKADGINMKIDKAEKGELVLTFNNVEPGTYAIMSLHDANENGRMDFEANGMPKENYGMSNNPMLMGPPTFEAVKFSVGSEDKQLNIRF